MIVCGVLSYNIDYQQTKFPTLVKKLPKIPQNSPYSCLNLSASSCFGKYPIGRKNTPFLHRDLSPALPEKIGIGFQWIGCHTPKISLPFKAPECGCNGQEMEYIITIYMDSKIYNKCKKYINATQIFFLIRGIAKIYNPQPLKGSIYTPVVMVDTAGVVMRCTPNIKTVFIFWEIL